MRVSRSSRASSFLCAVVTVLALVAPLGCSPGGSVLGGSPETTVKAFYEHLNKAEYSKAKDLYTTEARQLVDGQLMALAGGFAKFAEHETKGGTIQEVKIFSAEARGEGATVQYQVLYRDRSSATKSVSLTKEGGSWKMGVIP